MGRKKKSRQRHPRMPPKLTVFALPLLSGGEIHPRQAMVTQARQNCGPTTAGLPAPRGQGKLDPDVLAFVEALARYAARKDHEAQSKGPPTGLN